MEQMPPPPIGAKTASSPLIERIKNIITAPAKEWDVISLEQPNTPKTLMGYVVPLILISAVAAFIGYSFIGINIGFGYRWKGIDLGLKYALTILISGLAGVYLAAFVIDALAPTFKSEKNFDRSFQLVAYSYTPAWIAGIFNIFPPIAIIGSLLGLYSLYLLYLGLPKIKKTPQENQVGYFVVSLIVLIVAYFVIALIIGLILASVMGLSSPYSSVYDHYRY